MAEEPGKEKPADKGNVKADDQEKPATPDTAEQRPLSEYLNARNFLLWASVLGIALPFVFAAQSGSLATFATVSAVGIGILAASMATGGLLGFIFGIPTSLQNIPTPPPTADGQAGGAPAALYVGNTSLEQISDWLTKILVGVGLTQLSSIPTALADLGAFLAGGLGNLPGATVFAPTLVVFAILDGFFLSYLWTRLNLGSLLAQSDVNQRVAAAVREGRKLGKVDAAKTAIVTASAAVGTAAPGSAAPGPAGTIGILWVDDNPDYNTNERQAIRNLWKNAQFELAKSTDEALRLLKADPGRFALVISDMSRPGDREAGFTLLRSMRDAGMSIPTIFYAAAASLGREAEAQRLGATGITNDPNQLVKLVGEAMRELGAHPGTELDAKPATAARERR